MKKFKMIILWVLGLVALCLLSPIVLKILGIAFNLQFENILLSGFKVGLFAWIILILGSVFKNRNNEKSISNDKIEK